MPRFTALKSTDSSQKNAFLKNLLGSQASCQLPADTDILLGRAVVLGNSLSPRSDLIMCPSWIHNSADFPRWLCCPLGAKIHGVAEYAQALGSACLGAGLGSTTD